MRRGALPLLLSLGGALACGGPKPCTDCLQVAGLYSGPLVTSSTQCGAGLELDVTGGAIEFEVEQDQSVISADFGPGLGVLDGVLHQDGSATLGPTRGEAMPEDGSDGPPTFGNFYLYGTFAAEDAREPGFDGTLLFVSDDGCELDAKLSGSR